MTYRYVKYSVTKSAGVVRLKKSYKDTLPPFRVQSYEKYFQCCSFVDFQGGLYH